VTGGAARRRIGVEERRARLGRRHHLAARDHLDDVARLAGDLVGLHATDPAAVYLAAAARMRTPTIGAVQDALYDRRTVVRLLGMRRTMFVLPLELVPVVYGACTAAIASRERARLVKQLHEAGIDAAAAWLKEAEAATAAVLTQRGEATASELSAAVPALRVQLRYGEGRPWEAVQGVTSRVLSQLGADGRAVRGRPRGSWTSTQYRWAPMAAWLGADVEPRPPAEARAELARRWLASFGPATVDDLRWWTGWSAADTAQALATLPVAEVDLDGGQGVLLADDLTPVRSPAPWAALLPALDPTAMGWVERDWYLGEHRSFLFDRSGNVGPTVWWSGRVVGGWAQRAGGQVVHRLLEDVGGDAATAIAVAAERLQAWLGGTRITPKFRTPLERELSA
jgi:hypothetical protein